MPFVKPYDELYTRQITDDVDELTAPLVYDGPYGKVEVPVGFQSDGCTVYRWPFIFLIFGKIGKKAGFVHDYIYRKGCMSRDQADRTFYVCLVESGVKPRKAALMYQAVKQFARGIFWRYRDREYKNEWSEI